MFSTRSDAIKPTFKKINLAAVYWSQELGEQGEMGPDPGGGPGQ